jgi:hypothetical protein
MQSSARSIRARGLDDRKVTATSRHLEVGVRVPHQWCPGADAGDCAT